jgi:hypothetical protein
MMHVNLPHKVVAASTRTDLFFLFAHLLSGSQHHNTEFHVASKWSRNPRHRCLYNGSFAPKILSGLIYPQS